MTQNRVGEKHGKVKRDCDIIIIVVRSESQQYVDWKIV